MSDGHFSLFNMESNITNATLVRLAPVTFAALDYVVFALFLSVSAAVGVFFYCRSDKTTKDYFLGNRQIGPIPIGISSGVSFMSTASFMGLPAEMYVNGYSHTFTIIGAFFGFFLSACLVTNITQPLGIKSPNDYFLLH